MNKVVTNAEAAIHDIADGATPDAGRFWPLRNSRKLYFSFSKKGGNNLLVFPTMQVWMILIGLMLKRNR